MRKIKLDKVWKNKNHLEAKDSYLSDEYIESYYDLYLEQILIRNNDGGVDSYYWLQSKEPMKSTDTLRYDIDCPRCKGRLRIVGFPIDSHNHCLYRCPHCQKNIWEDK